MEFTLSSKHSRIPCEVTMDADNGRYMLRKADTSGEVFNEPNELLNWVENNWNENDFTNPQEFKTMLEQMRQELTDS